MVKSLDGAIVFCSKLTDRKPRHMADDQLYWYLPSPTVKTVISNRYQIKVFSSFTNHPHACTSITHKTPTHIKPYSQHNQPTINSTTTHPHTFCMFMYTIKPSNKWSPRDKATHGRDESRASALTSHPRMSAWFWARGPQSAGCSVPQWSSSLSCSVKIWTPLQQRVYQNALLSYLWSVN